MWNTAVNGIGGGDCLSRTQCYNCRLLGNRFLGGVVTWGLDPNELSYVRFRSE